MQLSGAWPDALEEARRACEHLRDHERPAEPGAAYYQLAELLRLRGEFDQAEEGYRQASQAGRKPQPGLALLRVAQGQDEAADAAIRLALRETRDHRSRVHMLSAAVHIALARRDRAGARAAVDELVDLAQTLDAPSRGEGGTRTAPWPWPDRLTPRWRRSTARDARGGSSTCPTSSRVRMLIGLAYRQLGTKTARSSSSMPRGNLRAAEAAPDGARREPPTRLSRASSGGLTGREIEVLRLIATGATNRAIATRLGISDKTVARHLSNIFTKLDLPSRSAATAYAYEHKLV